MKAAFIEKVGPAENIVYGELPDPKPGPREILVRMRAVTVNPVDTYIRSGKYPIDLPFPFIVGRDMIGEVVAPGSEVTAFRPGQRVWCNNQGYDGRQGTFAELLTINEEFLYPLPEAVRDEHKALIVLHSALTAAIGLFDKAKVRAGEALFLRGGSGNVGSTVLQVAKSEGVRVAVTAGSDEERQRCLGLGADLVVNYKTEPLEPALRAFAPEGLDVYWDLTMAPEIEPALAVLKKRSRIVFMAGAGHRCVLPIGPFYTHNITLFGYTITNATPGELHEAAVRVNDWLAKDLLQGRVADVLPLSKAAEAHRRQEQGIAGKIVLVPVAYP